MSAALNWLVALATLGTALLAVLARRPRAAGLAVAANALCVAAACTRLSAPIVAVAVALVGGALLVAAPERAPDSVRPAPVRAWPATLLTLIGCLLIVLALLSIVYVGYAPGQTALGASPPPPDGANAAALALTLFTDHGLAVLVAALLALAVAVRQRLSREAR
ncbi:MAG: hypothetical protein GX557_07110 [Chloroflexi bacterium]|nr:hypothetical protein [Chloroflexota bacterium]